MVLSILILLAPYIIGDMKTAIPATGGSDRRVVEHSKEKMALMEIVSTTRLLSGLKYTYIIGSMYIWWDWNNTLAWTLQALVDFRYTYIIGIIYDW